jgi:hypothetical protein
VVAPPDGKGWCCSVQGSGRGVAGGCESGTDNGVREGFAGHVFCKSFDGFTLVVGVVNSVRGW